MKKGGVVFKVGEVRYFLPATTASKVLPMPGVAHVPGAPEDLVGVALVEGEMVPVVDVGHGETPPSRRAVTPARPRTDNNRPMLVCTVGGERVGLVGLEVVATGLFDTAENEGVTHEGSAALLFDVAAVIGRLRDSRWAV
jgi:chemotaxis signal transduction protein